MPKYLPEKYQNPLLRIDEGYQETEELLYDMITDIKGVYGTAYKEMLAKSKKYLEWFVAADNAKRKLYEGNKISEEDYKNWRRTYMFQGRQTYGMLDTMAADLTNTNNIAASIINGYIPEVYAINGNYISYKCCKDLDMNIAFTLYDEQTVERLIREKPDLLPKAKVNIPKDLQWNKQHLTSAITQGILQGETVNQIAERLAKVTDMNENSAIRNARTMTTSAQNGGRQDGAERAQAMGIELEKMWLSCLDGRTRDSHRELDGEKTAVENKFSNGLMYPGDPHGAAGEVYNCRCTYTTVVKGAKVNPADMSQRYSKLGDMSYEEWKKGRQKEQNSASSDSKNATKALSEPKIHNLSLDNKANSAIIKTGSQSGAYNDKNDPDYGKRKKSAESYYEEMRNRDKGAEAKAISQNSDLTVKEAQIVIEHVFEDEHLFKDGRYERFAPDYNMQQSFMRIREGKNILKHDKTLLMHELEEAKLMRKNPKMVYEEAHAIAEKSHNYTAELKEYLKSKGGR